ncbi:glycoside hydrolase family 95 protein [Marasmius fiardii PR-910]|nr:glycoside hydrolase family 95 protein [Marasmius fiardii PR-910]
MLQVLVAIGLLSSSTSLAAPPGFPASGNGLWYTTPSTTWSKTYLPVGNGYLAAMSSGGTSVELTQLNIESLWSGGPFFDPSYNGGNKQPAEATQTADALKQYQCAVFSSPSGEISDISSLMTDQGAYGSYAGSGFLVSTVQSTGEETEFFRWLDLDEGVARVTWKESGATLTRETFCSHPKQACVQHIATTRSTLPNVTYAFSSRLQPDLPTFNVTCLDRTTLMVRGRIGGSFGMLYELLGRVHSTGGSIKCSPSPSLDSPSFPNATIVISGASKGWITWIGGTEFSQDAGNAEHSFSFRGPDPHDELAGLLPALNSRYERILAEHIQDFQAVLWDKFSLSLGQTPQLDIPTDQIRAAYKLYEGNPYLEWLTFNYGRYMLASSARGNLPANLQGKWASGTSNPWGADYHSNINIQMNYWSAEMSDLDVTKSLFDYFEKNWAPRGAETARLIYNITRGWVVHNEIFGHTGMKLGDAMWANYPEANAWMMMHVWDHFDYTNDVSWWKVQGWPLIKGVASFHLDKLMSDLYYNDNTLVVNPCNSPEQPPTTFGCAHAQQLIWELFNAIEKGFEAAGDQDTAFLNEVRAKRAQMDKGIRIGAWGQLQEWKVDKDIPTDTHRHLSHLIGLYPGYAITSYDKQEQGGIKIGEEQVTYSKEQVIDAARTSLKHRGDGNGPDADSGWEKALRAAAWAQLQDPEEFYHEVTYTISENLGPNLFSLYNPFDPDPIFQIDANLGFPGAVLNGILQAPDVSSFRKALKISILPALPQQWNKGEIRGARVRGGITVNMSWSDGKPTQLDLQVSNSPISTARPVEVVYDGKTVASFTTTPGLVLSIIRF